MLGVLNKNVAMNSIQLSIRKANRLVFFILSVRLLLSYFGVVPNGFLGIGIFLIIVLLILAVLKLNFVIYIFVSSIPLVSGVKNILGSIESLYYVKSAPILSLSFATIYVAWYIQKLIFYDRSQRVITKVLIVIECFIFLVNISLIFSLMRYPSNILWRNILSVPITGQDHSFWCLQASFIYLQGVFLFLIVFEENLKLNFSYIYIYHFGTMAIFFLIQFLFSYPPTIYDLFYSPFEDPHSFGSYAVFIVFSLFQIQRQNFFEKVALSVMVLFAILLIFKSGSFSAIISFLFTLLMYAFYKGYKIQSIIVAAFFLTIFVLVNISTLNVNTYGQKNENKQYVLSNPLFGIKFEEKSFPVTGRVLERISLENIRSVLQGREKSWDQALGIVEVFPLEGKGVGTFYKSSRYYSYSGKYHTKRIENAHNYYLQIASELGLPSLMLFLLSVLFVAKNAILKLFERIKSDDYPSGLLFGLCAYMLTLISSHPMILSNQAFLFWIILISIRQNENSI